MNRCKACETALDDIDAWRAGKRGTVGRPADGQGYPLAMRDAVKRLEVRLLACDCAGGEGTRAYLRAGGH